MNTSPRPHSWLRRPTGSLADRDHLLSRRQVLHASAVGLVAVGLSACSGGGGGASAGTKKLRFLCDETDPKSIKALQDGFAAWEKTTSFRVDAQFLSPDEFSARIPQLMGSNDPPDIVRHTNSNIAQWVNSGWLAPVNDVVESLGTISHSWRIRKGNDDYAVPMDWTCWMQFYRRDIFDKAGVEPATTWDEYRDLIDKLRGTNGMYPNLLVTADSEFASSQMLNPLWENGCRPWSYEEGKWRASLADGANRERAIEALQYFAFRAKHSPASGNFNWPEVNQVYGTGKIAMIEYFGGRTLQLLQEQSPGLLDKTGIAPMTRQRQQAIQGDASGFAVFNTTKERVSAARDLLTYFMDSPSYLDFLWSVPTQQFPPQQKLYQGKWREHPLLKKRPDLLETVEKSAAATFVPLYPPGASDGAGPNVLGAGFLYSGPYARMNAQVAAKGVDPGTAVDECAAAMTKYANDNS